MSENPEFSNNIKESPWSDERFLKVGIYSNKNRINNKNLNKMNKGGMLYEGKAKQVFATENPEEVIVKFKDDATAFNAQKRGSFDLKAPKMNNTITTLILNIYKKRN